jgi:hypothetical protein
MSQRKKPSDFAKARDMIDYLGGDDKCGEDGCTECRVIDREEAIYFVGEVFAARDAAEKQCASAERELNEAWKQRDRYLAALKAEAIRTCDGPGDVMVIGDLSFRVELNEAGELVAEEVRE